MHNISAAAVRYVLVQVLFWTGGFGFGGVVTGMLLVHGLAQGTTPPATDWLTGLGGLGVGGVLAGLVITWKRQDDQTHAKDMADVHSRHDKTLEAMYARLESSAERVLKAFETNTATVGVLVLNMNHDSTGRQEEHARLETSLRDLLTELVEIKVNVERQHPSGRSTGRG